MCGKLALGAILADCLPGLYQVFVARLLVQFPTRTSGVRLAVSTVRLVGTRNSA